MQNQINKRVAIITSSPLTIKVFLYDQIINLAKKYELSIITNLKDDHKDLISNLPDNIEIYSIPIERTVNILSDLKCLFFIHKLFKKKNFNLVHSFTPKAGLLTSIVGWFNNIQFRLHTFTGQVWITKNGINRLILKFADNLINFFATHILIDSSTQRDFLISQGIVKKECSTVLKYGSISGVDFSKFYPDNKRNLLIRSKLEIKETDLVLLYVGRLSKDKGIIDLCNSFKNLSKIINNLKLIIVGYDEDNLIIKIKDILGSNNKNIYFISFTKNQEHYMMAADIFILPSYREGFGTSIIEAAACGIPSIASRIYGLTDAVVDGKTGLLFNHMQKNKLSEAILKLAKNRKLRLTLGQNALNRTRELFDQKDLTNATISYYSKLLK